MFSSVVDDFTHINLTEAEAIEIAREYMGLLDACQKVERGLKDEIPWKHGVYGDGTARWKDALRVLEAVHGKAAVDKVLAEIEAETTKERSDV
jgi:hypothetical protein